MSVSSEYPAVNGDEHPSELDSDPAPVNKWDIQALEAILETLVAKQAVMADQVLTIETQVLTLRKIVENSINVQLQDRQEVNRKLDIILQFRSSDRDRNPR